MMKKTFIVALVLSIGLILSGNAFALTTENWLIDIAKVVTPLPQGLYDRGTLYSLDGSGYWNPLPGSPAGALSLQDGVFYNGGRDGVEDTWGIFRIASIVGSESGTVYNAETAGYQIVGMFYGFDDAYIALQDDGQAKVYGVDGRVELWKNTNDFATSVTSGTRSGNTFSGITEGDLLLAADGHVRTTLTGNQYTFSSMFDFNAPYGGSGNFYLDVDTSNPGLWTDKLNTNGFLTSTQSPADVYINFSSEGEGAPENWTVFGNGQGQAKAVIPEPASMILMGIGLFGAARLRRKS